MTTGQLVTAGTRYRWLVCLLLFLATSINYIDRQVLSLLKPLLDVELGWTNAEFGKVNAAFQGAYAIGLIGFGVFVDRFGTKIGYAVSIVAWSFAALLHPFAGSAAGFTYARVALGLGEGGNFPAAIKATGTWFPKRERALATALFNSGANVGAVLAPAVVPWLAIRWGWRSAFIVAGAAGFVWVVAWLRLYRNPLPSDVAAENSVEPVAQASAAVAPISWGSLLAHRQTWSFVCAKFFTDPVWWFFLIWLPDYFKKARGLDIKNSWVLLVSIYSIVTVFSIVGGWLVGALTKRGWPVLRARKTAMLLFAFAVMPIIAVGQVGDWGAVVLIGVAGAAHQAWSANLFTTVSDMFPNQAVARVVGIGGMAGSIGGILFPILTGMLLDRFQTSGNIGAGYAVLFGFCGCAYLVAFVLNHALAPKFAPIATQAAAS